MTVSAIVQDRLGFLWFGTGDGLNRFDGLRFEVYRHNPGDSGSLPKGSIEALIESRAGDLWVGTDSGGLVRFDPVSGKISRPEGSYDTPPRGGITCLLEDARDRLWVGTRSGLYRFDPAGGEWAAFRHDPQDPGSLGDDSVYDLARSGNGQLWVATRAGLDRLDPASGRATRFQHRPGEAGSLAASEVRELHLDPSGTLWVGTWGGGLHRFEDATESFTRFPNGDDLTSNRVRSLTSHREGELWVGTQGRGLFRFDPATGRFEGYQRVGDDPHSLSGNSIFALHEDSSGALWAGTWGYGVNRFEPGGPTFQVDRHDAGNPGSLSHNSVGALLEDRSGILWVGTHGGGVSVRAAGEKDFARLPTVDDSPSELTNWTVYALLEDGEGKLWIGGHRGLDVFDLSRRRVLRHYRHDAADPRSLGGDVVRCLLRDRSGTIWIGTLGAGLDRFDLGAGGFLHYRHDPDDPASLGSDRVYALLETSGGELWIGTRRGISVRFPGNTSFRHFVNDPADPGSLRGDVVLTLFADRGGTVWAGTLGGGLNRFDAETESFRAYTEADGLANDVVYSITEDELGRLWLGTNRGLSRFDPRSESWASYDPADGLGGYEFNTGAVVRRADGEVSFGGIEGLVTFDPGRFQEDTEPPPVVLTSFEVFQHAFDAGRSPPYLEQVELDPDENFFSFEFAALAFRRPDKNRYAYRLEGLEEHWVEAGSRRFASYTSVPPGEYVFRVKAANVDGVWNEEGASVRLEIASPLWARWWAYLIYSALVLALVGGSVASHRRKVAQERRINRRLRQLDRLKDEFLANTSHELRTPLYGITGLAESLIDGAAGPVSDAMRKNLSMIVTSGRRLGHLVDDILDFEKLKHHGLVLRRKPVDLWSLADVVLTLSRPLVGEKELTLENSVDRDLPPADADENRLQQILLNLVGNAVKFTETGSVVVVGAVKDGELEVRVADTGIGIPSDRLDRIFEAFEQVDGAIEREYGGTGLGLAVTRRLVELHGGRIWARSTPGQGSIFYFTLPLASEEVVAERQASPTAVPTAFSGPEPSSISVTGQGPRILIVDDEPVNRQVLSNHLAPEGYRLQRAASGDEALRRMERSAFDLVLLDVMMPKMSGYEVCREIRQRFTVQQLPVIFLTAKSLPSDLVNGFVAGANDYLIKPVAKDELLARVATHLDLLRIHRELAEAVEERSLRLAERERLLAERGRLIEELEAKNADLARINYTFSHDLKNPVVTIKNYVSLVERDAETGENGRLLGEIRRIRRAADQMHQLLEELYQYSKISYESIEPADVSPAKIVYQALDQLSEQVAESGAEVSVADDLPAIRGDREQLLQAFKALLDNALKFSGGEAPRIEIGWRPEAGAFYVRDQGPGIEPRYHEKVFELFDRLDPEIAGTGLGLALVRRILEAHGGRIWVESEGLGRGSTFCFVLPRVEG